VDQDRGNLIAAVNAEMNFRVPLNAGDFFSGCATGGLSNDAQLYSMSY
jgi:hypothetical protein